MASEGEAHVLHDDTLHPRREAEERRGVEDNASDRENVLRKSALRLENQVSLRVVVELREAVDGVRDSAKIEEVEDHV
jgi:hypothetical protein